jgi:hypothetical protein
MEVDGNILPVDLRIEEIAVREIAKIQSKSIAEPVKQQLEEYLSRDDIYEQESPFGKAINQSDGSSLRYRSLEADSFVVTWK